VLVAELAQALHGSKDVSLNVLRGDFLLTIAISQAGRN